MSICIICFLRRLHRPNLQITVGQQHSSISDLTAELEDSRKFSLNSLMALLAILGTSGPSNLKRLQSMVLMLLIYTISLRLAVNNCFLRNYPTPARFLHVIPLMGTSCMAGVVLVSNEQSPARATICVLLGVLPLVSIVIHHGRHCCETAVAELPMQDVPVPVVSGSGDATLASS